MTNAERCSMSAAVFTGLTDVELEIDGLLTFDRAVIKMGAQPLHRIHSQLIQASKALNDSPAGQCHSSHPRMHHHGTVDRVYGLIVWCCENAGALEGRS